MASNLPFGLPSPPSTGSNGTMNVLPSGDDPERETLRRLGWTNQRRRIGSPPLVELPLRRHSLEDSPEEPVKLQYDSLQPQIEQALRTNNVKNFEVDLVLRVDYAATLGALTIFVHAEADATYQQSWPDAIEEIRGILDSNGLTAERIGRPIYIEIMDPVYEAHWAFDPIDPDHPLARQWDQILKDLVWPTIHALPPRVKDDVHSINAFGFGVRGSDVAPVTPTVLVSINPGHPWSAVRSAENIITSGLRNQYGAHDSHCVFEPGMMVLDCFD